MFIFAGCRDMHSFVLGCGFCHLCSSWKFGLPPTYGTHHSKFFWGLLVPAHRDVGQRGPYVPAITPPVPVLEDEPPADFD